MSSSPKESIGSTFAKIPVPPDVGEWIATIMFRDEFWNMEERIDDYKKGKCEDNLWEYFNPDDNKYYDGFFEQLNGMAEYITDKYPILITDIVDVINKYNMTAEDLVYDDQNEKESWAAYHRRELPPSEVYPAIGFLKYRVLHAIESVTDSFKWSNWDGYRKQFVAYHENKINRIKRAVNEYEEWKNQHLSDMNDFNAMQEKARKLLFGTNYKEDEPSFIQLEESDYEVFSDIEALVNDMNTDEEESSADQ